MLISRLSFSLANYIAFAFLLKLQQQTRLGRQLLNHSWKFGQILVQIKSDLLKQTAPGSISDSGFLTLKSRLTIRLSKALKFHEALMRPKMVIKMPFKPPKSDSRSKIVQTDRSYINKFGSISIVTLIHVLSFFSQGIMSFLCRANNPLTSV